MGLFGNLKRFGLCVTGQGVIEVFGILDFALKAMEDMKRDSYLSSDSIYVKDFESEKVYK
jgi:hypothetical protein